MKEKCFLNTNNSFCESYLHDQVTYLLHLPSNDKEKEKRIVWQPKLELNYDNTGWLNIGWETCKSTTLGEEP